MALHRPAATLLAAALAAALFPPWPARAQPACPAPGLRIGRITIERRAVFDTGPSAGGLQGRLGQFANPLHVRTRERVIRDELLFREGDPCRDEALAQSERNLRARGLFQWVAVVATLQPGGAADVRVSTQDAWTLRVSGDFARIGGAIAWDVGLAETNLAGEGVGLGVRHREEIGATISTAWLAHDRLFGSRERLGVRLDQRSDGDARAISLTRPFFAIDSRWAHEFSASRLRDDWRLYDRGEETDRFARRADDLTAGVAARIGGSRPDRAWRAGAGYRFSALEVGAGPDGSAAAPGDMPPSHRWAGPYVTLEFLQHRFVKRAGLMVPGRDADINLGWQFDASAWASLRSARLETASRVITGAALSRGWAPGKRTIVLATAGITVRSGGIDPPDADAVGSLRAWRQHSPTHVTAAAADLRSLLNPEPGSRLYLGGSAGMVGYREFSVYGTRTARVQVEDRRYFPWRPAGLVQFGVAGFAEAGTAGGRTGASLHGPLLADVGVGLRIAQLKSAANSAARVDIAFPLTAPFGGHRHPLIVVGYRRDF